VYEHPQANFLDQLQEQITLLHTEEDDDVQLQIMARHICDDHGLGIMGFGGRRFAIAVESSGDTSLVAKLAWRQAGLADNELELRLWHEADKNLRDLLAPTISQTLLGVNLQGRCLPIAAGSMHAHSSLTRRLARAGITDAVLNLGIYQDHIVCYDYATLAPERATRLLRRS